jgi:hypothetical protein
MSSGYLAITISFTTDVFFLTANPRTSLWLVVSEASGLKDISSRMNYFLLIHMCAIARLALSLMGIVR